MTTKVVIAAAGEGTRMLNLTKDCSKHLLKVCERPFLAYLLDSLINTGYRELILVVGYKGELIQEFIKSYNAPKNIKADIKTINQYEVLGPKDKEYGTACPVKCAKDLVKNDDFLYINGDNLFSSKDLSAMNISDGYNYVGGMEHENPEKYGVLVMDADNFLLEIKEKPKVFAGNIINAGIYKFTSEIFDKISQIKKSLRGEYEITDAINLLAKEGKVRVKKINDYWLDFGTPEDVEKVSKFISKNGCNN